MLDGTLAVCREDFGHSGAPVLLVSQECATLLLQMVQGYHTSHF